MMADLVTDISLKQLPDVRFRRHWLTAQMLLPAHYDCTFKGDYFENRNAGPHAGDAREVHDFLNQYRTRWGWCRWLIVNRRPALKATPSFGANAARVIRHVGNVFSRLFMKPLLLPSSTSKTYGTE